MLPETERTRAIRRAMHDSYAPYVVRPALRRDTFNRSAPVWNYLFAAAILVFVAQFLRWTFSAW